MTKTIDVFLFFVNSVTIPWPRNRTAEEERNKLGQPHSGRPNLTFPGIDGKKESGR
jgi:hypothetical protein